MGEKIRTNLFWLLFIVIGLVLLILGIKFKNIGLDIVGIVFIAMSIFMITMYCYKKK